MAETLTSTGSPGIKAQGAAPAQGADKGDDARPGNDNTPLVKETTLVVDAIYCGACMITIEDALHALPGVKRARVNLTTRRVRVSYDVALISLEDITETLEKIGYPAAELIEGREAERKAADQDLLRRLGVAGFAAANIMLLSVSVWAGAASDMTASVQSLFHWLSAIIALPAIAYAGYPFFSSAMRALKSFRLNMDVPISLGVILATGMSLAQTVRGTEQVYFDAAVMLLFFLLIGRFLHSRMRTRAAGAAANLLGLTATNATLIGEDGANRRVSARQLRAGDRILVAAGERIAADGKVETGCSEISEALITGESVPRAVKPGDQVYAGTTNAGNAIVVSATATDEGTLVAEIARLMESAEQDRGRYVRLADRAARVYAPAVHILGFATFAGWMLAGAGWEYSLTLAIAVLIITCPCALALAVPAVQVAASSRLFQQGVIIKSGSGLERLSEIDTVVFDKTGTLSLGEPRLVNPTSYDPAMLARAASLAANSRHPYSRALVRAAENLDLQCQQLDGVEEIPGSGLRLVDENGLEERLGSRDFVVGRGRAGTSGEASLFYSAPDGNILAFSFQDALRPDAAEVVATLQKAGLAVELLSGDREAAVEEAALDAGISDWRARQSPADKIARLEELANEGRTVLMVGDGLNDAPALAAGHASLSPSSAADISQTAADAIFQGAKLGPLVESIVVARGSQSMAKQNFAIALAYNAVFVPLAVAGFVTPLIAAIAMSASSIAVTANAIRLRGRRLALS